MKKFKEHFLKFLFWFTGFLPCKLIKVNDQPYLERYLLFNFLGFTCFIHRFVSSDPEEHLHDHPWPAASVVLSGGYVEKVFLHFCAFEGVKVKKRRVNRFNFIPAVKFHQIEFVEQGTWTLFFHGRRFKSWGFLHQLEDFEDGRQGKACVAYEQPFDVGGIENWKECEKGAEIGREAFQAVNDG